MNFIDLTILIIAILFSVRGIVRGFILEITGIIGLIAGYLIAMFYLEQFSQRILTYFPTLSKSFVHIIGFIILFVVTNFVLKLVAHLATKTLKLAMLGWLNRLLGGVVGLFKGIIVMSALVFLFSFLPGLSLYLEKADVAHSIFYPVLNTLGPELYHWITNFVKTI
jgi:membrane protein required for colicin V production